MKKLFFLIPLLLAALLTTQSHAATEDDSSIKGHSLGMIMSVTSKAEKSIRIAAYSFTSKSICEALAEAQRRGVDVKVVADEKNNIKNDTLVTYLANHGVLVRLNSDAVSDRKFIVVDNEVAAALHKGSENAFILYDVPEVAHQYTRDWQKLWDESYDWKKK